MSLAGQIENSGQLAFQKVDAARALILALRRDISDRRKGPPLLLSQLAQFDDRRHRLRGLVGFE